MTNAYSPVYWCSTKVDINGFHIRGPFTKPGVGSHHNLTWQMFTSSHNFTHQKYCVDFFTFSEICWLLWPHLSQSEFCFLVWPLATLMSLSSKWTSLDMDIICYTYFFIHSSLTYLFCDAIFKQEIFLLAIINYMNRDVNNVLFCYFIWHLNQICYGSEMRWFLWHCMEVSSL